MSIERLNKVFQNKILIFFLLLFISILISGRGLVVGVFNGKLLSGHDSSAYPMFQSQFDANIESGNLIPIWASSAQYGYGEPILEFRPPLFAYVTEFFYYITGHLFFSINASCLFFIVLSVFGAFFFGVFILFKTDTPLEKILNSIFLATSYVLSPYFLSDIYVRGAYSELSAFAIIPWISFCFIKLAQEKKLLLLAFSSLNYFLLSISHSPIFMIISCALIFGILFYRKKIQNWMGILSAAFLGMGLSAFYWVPLFLEKKYIKAAIYPVDYESYVGHFRRLDQLLYSSFYFSGGYGPELGMSYFAGVVCWAGFFWYLWKWAEKKEQSKLKVPFILSILSIYFIHRLSAFWYEAFPLLQVMSFSWRFLTLFTAAGTVLGACAIKSIIDHYSGQNFLLKYKIWALVFISVLGLGFLHATPEQYQFFTPLHFSNELIARTGFGFQKPASSPSSAGELPKTSASQIAETIGGRVSGKCEPTGATSGHCSLLVIQPTKLRINILDYPGWTVYVNDKKVEHETEKPSGTILVSLLAGEHNVAWVLENTPVRLFSKILSALSLLGLSIIIGLGLFRKQSQPSSS